MKNAVRPFAFSSAFLLAATLVPGGAAFAQGGMWRPDPALGAAPVIETAGFRPGAPVYQPRVAQPQARAGFVPAAPQYRAVDSRTSHGRYAHAPAAPAWRNPDRAVRATERYAPATRYGWAYPPMGAPMPWAAPLPPAAPAHAGYLAYAMPTMPAYGGMQPVQWPPAMAYHAYPHVQQPSAYRPAPVQAPPQWNQPARGQADLRPLPGGWRPDPLAAAMEVSRHTSRASAYTSPRHPVFRGAALAGVPHAQARPALRPQPVAGYWRPDTSAGWASRQTFRPVAYGRSIALNAQAGGSAVDAVLHDRGELPGWASTVDRFEGTGQCAWCSSGT